MAFLTKEQQESNKKAFAFEVANDILSKTKIAIASNKLELKDISEEDCKKIKFGYDTAIKLAITALNNVVKKYEVI